MLLKVFIVFKVFPSVSSSILLMSAVMESRYVSWNRSCPCSVLFSPVSLPGKENVFVVRVVMESFGPLVENSHVLGKEEDAGARVVIVPEKEPDIPLGLEESVVVCTVLGYLSELVLFLLTRRLLLISETENGNNPPSLELLFLDNLSSVFMVWLERVISAALLSAPLPVNTISVRRRISVDLLLDLLFIACSRDSKSFNTVEGFA